MKNSVVIVNEHDQMLGTMDKLAAHRLGMLHRALSVFIFNSRGEILLQQRAIKKYHSGGLWSNTCCSHPYPGEDVSHAAKRRLMEEMGIDAELEYAFHFIYRENVGNGLIENEYDHVFVGICDAVPKSNPAEVADYQYVPVRLVESELLKNPGQYTKWLKICFPQIIEYYQNYLKTRNLELPR